MLLAQKLLTPLHSMVKIFGTLTCIIYTQPKNKKERYKGYLKLYPTLVQQYPLRIFITVVFVVLVLAQIVHSVKFSGQTKISSAALVPSILFFLSALAHIPSLVGHYNQRYDFCPIFNAFLDFERRHNGNGWLPEEALVGVGKRIRKYVYVLLWTPPLVTLIYWKQQIEEPCYPGNLGYLFLSECSGNSANGNKEFTQKVLMSTLSSWAYLLTVTTALMEYSVLMVHSYCIMNYLRLFTKKFCETELTRSNVNNLMQMYREIELLLGRLNGFHGGSLVVAYILNCTSGLITALYTIFGLYREMSFQVLLNCGIIAFDAFSAMKDFDGGYKSGVFKVSKKVISKVRSHRGVLRERVLKRKVRSWRVLRVYLGQSNYFDELTPLSLINFSVTTTVSLLLL